MTKFFSVESLPDGPILDSVVVTDALAPVVGLPAVGGGDRRCVVGRVDGRWVVTFVSGAPTDRVYAKVSATRAQLEILARHLREKAEELEVEAHDADHERNKHVDRFRIRIGGDLPSAEETDVMRAEAFALRYFVRQLHG